MITISSVTAEWITIAPIVQAIQVLEHHSARVATARSADTLWPVLVAKVGSKHHVSAEIVRQLNAYRDHLNTLFGTDKTPIIPPGPDGLPWRITTRQFRRTIAWHIANRPFGSIAGMIQYKHASVAAFEGYAGSEQLRIPRRGRSPTRSRSDCEIFSTGFNSGDFGGNGMSVMLSGTGSFFETCHPA